MSGKAVSRALRAHFVSESAVMTILIELVEELVEELVDLTPLKTFPRY